MDRRSHLERACRSYSVAAVYLFGSRADEGLRLLQGAHPEAGASDLDVGVFLGTRAVHPDVLADLQVAMEDVFSPLRVDLVPLDRVDALFQFRAIDGHRVYGADGGLVDRWELRVMRRAAELLPVQRAIEREQFGVSTS